MADGFRIDFDFSRWPAFVAAQKGMMVDAAADTMQDVKQLVTASVRTAMMAAVPGRRAPSRLGRGWRIELYPKNGRSYLPTIEVRPYGKLTGRTWGALSAFAKGATIRSRRGGWIAVPTDFAARLSWRRNRNGETESPERWAARTGNKLRLVVPKEKGFMLLVVDPPRRNRAAAGGPADRPQVAFVLLREVGIDKRFDLNAAVRPYRVVIEEEFVRRHKLLQEKALAAPLSVRAH